MPQKISSQDIDKYLAKLDAWQVVDGREAIHKSFKFPNFKAAFDFMQQIAFYAEQINHHPEWTNIYNRMDVTLSTHDVNGLSELDFQMAAKMDSII